MAEVKLIPVAPAEDGIRLDRWLRRRWPHLAQTQIHKLARSGQIRVDGSRVKADTRLAAASIVRVPPLPLGPPPAERDAVSPRDIAFARSMVLYEDDEVLALNKPAGLAVQGGAKTTRHIDALLGVWGEGLSRPRLTHRLDRDTSGVLVLGKGPDAAAALSGAFAHRRAEKTYWALVAGLPRPSEGTVDMPLAKIGTDERERMVPVEADHPEAKPAVSYYSTLSRAGDRVAWVALRPLTGRTHQLRAHLLAMGCPILGDPKYNTPESRDLSGDLKLQLHARRIVLPHPGGGRLDLSAPIGAELKAGFKRFGFEAAEAPEDPFANAPRPWRPPSRRPDASRDSGRGGRHH